MAYISLYRKWRPEDFVNLVGQEHITKTLRNAIQNAKVAHAYLFAGPRGTGKTSLAKVFARALNCEKGPTPEPCGECPNCVKVKNGNSLNVIEIDAASNRGIDEIRELRDKVRFLPPDGRYKVYIIDEVHMLTTEAFNALLKTLDEPPQHVIFILATTEPHKVLPTILSRCQRFDFRRINFNAMVNRLEKICAAEGIETEKDALYIIARNADGGMRDALSVLEQCISYIDVKLTASDVYAVLGMVDDRVYPDIARAIKDSDSAQAIQIINQIVDQGKDIIQFTKGMLSFWRDVLLTKVSPDISLDLPEGKFQNIKDIAGRFPLEKIIRFIETVNETDNALRWSAQPLYIVELMVIKMVTGAADGLIELQASTGPVHHSQDRITLLEQKVDSLLRHLAKGDLVIPANATKAVRDVSSAQPVVNALREEVESVVMQPKVNVEVLQGQKEQNNELPKAGTSEQTSSSIDVLSIKKKWDLVLDEVKKKKVSIAALLKEAEPVEFNGNLLILLFKNEYKFHKENIEKTGHREIVEDVINRLLTSSGLSSQKIRIVCHLKDSYISSKTSEKVKSEIVQEKPAEKPDKDALLLQKAIELFDGKLV